MGLVTRLIILYPIPEETKLLRGGDKTLHNFLTPWEAVCQRLCFPETLTAGFWVSVAN